jgi:hypothetical protein
MNDEGKKSFYMLNVPFNSFSHWRCQHSYFNLDYYFYYYYCCVVLFGWILLHALHTLTRTSIQLNCTFHVNFMNLFLLLLLFLLYIFLVAHRSETYVYEFILKSDRICVRLFKLCIEVGSGSNNNRSK